MFLSSSPCRVAICSYAILYLPIFAFRLHNCYRMLLQCLTICYLAGTLLFIFLLHRYYVTWVKSNSFLDVTELLLFISLPQYNFLSIILSCYYLETTSLKHTNKYSNKNDYGKLVTYKNHTEYDSGWVYNYLHGYAGALQS